MGVNGFEVEHRLSEAGWHFFFIVPATSSGSLSSDHNKAVRRGLKKILSKTEAQNFNALEIVEITTKRLLGLCYVKIIAYPRQVRNSPFLRDLSPYYSTRNVWDFKQGLRRRARIGRTAGGSKNMLKARKEGRMNHLDEESQQPGATMEVEALLASQKAPARGESAYSRMSHGFHQTAEREYGLDNTLSETFPCSDPLSSIPNPTSLPL